MDLNVRLSPGEFLDKLTILEIKLARIADPAKRRNVALELELMRAAWAASSFAGAEVSSRLAELKSVNEALWEIEDRIRAKEAREAFDAEFVQLARSVYRDNDRRAAIKREINLMLRSDLIEEKSYSKYDKA